MKKSLAVYQTAQIRELERLASSRFGITNEVLMERAAKAAFDFMLQRFPGVKRVMIFCGAGNNGGDGYVLAKLAHDHGIHVEVIQVGDHSKHSKEAAAGLSDCQRSGMIINKLKDKLDVKHTDLIVDAICGIGAKDNMRDEVLLAIENIHRANVPVLALDIPTGIHADTGEVLGAAVHAAATVTFIGIKLGLLTGDGASYSGEVVVNDLRLSNSLMELVAPIAEKITLEAYREHLKPRLKNWHKGMSGHVLVIGGAAGFSGAARMAGMAALRVGAGLVSVATDVRNATIMNANCPELMCHGIAKAEELQPLLDKASVIILGPGLGQSPWSISLWMQAMKSSLPMVVDADALTLLAGQPTTGEHWVLTPHPGEAAKLLKVNNSDIQQDRLQAITKMTKAFGGVCVLKGAGTLVSKADAITGVCDKGNPGMATAGMGDVLSGVIGGLLAQGIPAIAAAKLGVAMHAAAGDLAAKDGERGMIATDLLPYLRQLSNL